MVTLELSANECIMRIEHLSPRGVTQRGGKRVDSTMSVNSTVANSRSGTGSDRAPVRNSSISASTGSGISPPVVV